MAEIRDDVAIGAAESLVVGSALILRSHVEVVPLDTRVIERADDLLGLVGASISDHEELEVRELLVEHALYRVRKDRRVVVGRDDCGDSGHYQRNGTMRSASAES